MAGFGCAETGRRRARAQHAATRSWPERKRARPAATAAAVGFVRARYRVAPNKVIGLFSGFGWRGACVRSHDVHFINL